MNAPRLHRPLAVTAVAMAGLAAVAAAGIVVDDRVLLGVPIWLKPFKFAISLVVYTGTLAYLIGSLQDGSLRGGSQQDGSLRGRPARHAGWLGNVIVAASFVEMAVIVGQVVRGRRSHFNVETPLDSALWGVMAVTILMLWIATALIGVVLLRHYQGDRPTVLAVRYGLLISLAGMAIGFLMTQPTAEQQAGFADGPPTLVGSHSVGVAEGGPGLPLVNWSTTGGDLRVAHFIGLHALQALPLLAFGLARAARRWPVLRPDRVRNRLVGLGAVGMAGITALTTWQALRGQPVASPDTLTLGSAGLLAAGLAVGAAVALRRPVVRDAVRVG
ncbi:hypothetical protein [Virgisporangium aurantiacum]|uniref:Uncharacterized protein n=1 Tax=Virgisporangium aurantiacum TaxID=175570 RepID=A0A8J4E1D9_9ACTN|nr:hypothetical protein [Virgisporangium aurantiacum]GIJ57924.1 hypothetical protein Vau01_054400 [Virgisporangium aurantiacum]